MLMMKLFGRWAVLLSSTVVACAGAGADSLVLNDQEYLETTGLNVMLAHDYYPESHQGGVGVIQTPSSRPPTEARPGPLSRPEHQPTFKT